MRHWYLNILKLHFFLKEWYFSLSFLLISAFLLGRTYGRARRSYRPWKGPATPARSAWWRREGISFLGGRPEIRLSCVLTVVWVYKQVSEEESLLPGKTLPVTLSNICLSVSLSLYLSIYLSPASEDGFLSCGYWFILHVSGCSVAQGMELIHI